MGATDQVCCDIVSARKAHQLSKIYLDETWTLKVARYEVKYRWSL